MEDGKETGATDDAMGHGRPERHYFRGTFVEQLSLLVMLVPLHPSLSLYLLFYRSFSFSLMKTANSWYPIQNYMASQPEDSNKQK